MLPLAAYDLDELLRNANRSSQTVLRADFDGVDDKTGVMERLGLGYDVLSQANPGLIYCSVSAYGRTGAFADHDVDTEILHREVEHLLGSPRDAVDLVEEEGCGAVLSELRHMLEERLDNVMHLDRRT